MCDGAGACEVYRKGQDCSACGGGGPAQFAYQCDGLGACVPGGVAACIDDHILKSIGGASRDCFPFACTADGTCRETCQSNEDCSGGTMCNAAGACAPPPSAPSRPEWNGCMMHASTRGADGAWPLALLAVLFLRRRRAERAAR
jgi:hypothetical protein